MHKRGVLVILDGYGEGPAGPYNAVKNANTPTLDSIKKNNLSLIKTDGEAVGLFEGELGGSEVGHTTIGAGRIVLSTAKKIAEDIASGEFAQNKKLLKKIETLEKNVGNLHLVGLMSDKNIHSDINHAYEIMRIFNMRAQNIFIHFITDGRDSGTHDSIKYLKEMKSHMKDIQNCEIASVMGRFYAMDREKNYDRTDLAIKTMFNTKDGIESKNLKSYIESEHGKGITDEYIHPVHVMTKSDSILKKNDLVFFFNFREDRLRQIVDRTASINKNIITMSRVSSAKTTVLYPTSIVKGTLSEHLSKLGLRQIKISETTKYAHVTYYLNGGREAPFENEDRIHIPTIKTTDFSRTPKMRAKEITDEVIKAMTEKYDAIIVNYSNPDMIGHTGNYDAVVKALEFIDKCISKLIKSAKENDYSILFTADHGNSEQMMRADGTPHTAHTLNKVFMSIYTPDAEIKLKPQGELKDIAPTFLDLMNVKPNKYFTGESLIK